MTMENNLPKENKRGRKRAIALAYDSETNEAPIVVASGKGYIAEQILEIARENNIPIKEDTMLTQALAQVNLDQAIPPQLYAIVAEILAFVYRLRNKEIT